MYLGFPWAGATCRHHPGERPTSRSRVFRAVYTEVDARLQIQASILGGSITVLNEYEADKPHATSRPWQYWKNRVKRAF